MEQVDQYTENPSKLARDSLAGKICPCPIINIQRALRRHFSFHGSSLTIYNHFLLGSPFCSMRARQDTVLYMLAIAVYILTHRPVSHHCDDFLLSRLFSPSPSGLNLGQLHAALHVLHLAIRDMRSGLAALELWPRIKHQRSQHKAYILRRSNRRGCTAKNRIRHPTSAQQTCIPPRSVPKPRKHFQYRPCIFRSRIASVRQSLKREAGNSAYLPTTAPRSRHLLRACGRCNHTLPILSSP